MYFCRVVCCCLLLIILEKRCIFNRTSYSFDPTVSWLLFLIVSFVVRRTFSPCSVHCFLSFLQFLLEPYPGFLAIYGSTDRFSFLNGLTSTYIFLRLVFCMTSFTWIVSDLWLSLYQLEAAKVTAILVSFLLVVSQNHGWSFKKKQSQCVLMVSSDYALCTLVAVGIVRRYSRTFCYSGFICDYKKLTFIAFPFIACSFNF